MRRLIGIITATLGQPQRKVKQRHGPETAAMCGLFASEGPGSFVLRVWLARGEGEVTELVVLAAVSLLVS